MVESTLTWLRSGPDGIIEIIAISFELARIAQSAAAKVAKMSARWAGVCSPWAKNSCGAQSGHRPGVRAAQQAQGVREFAGEAARVGDQVDVDQHPLQLVFAHGTQDREVQGGSAQRAVLHLAAPPGGVVPGAGRFRRRRR
ncbi:hypothetical protein [Streptomyces sp. MN13]